MRWIALAAVSVACSSGLIGCGDSDHPVDPGSEAGSAGDSGSSGLAGSAGHAGAGHAGSGHAGELGAGSGGSAEAGAANGGAGGDGVAGGATAGSGGATAGAGGATAGSGGATAGSGGATAGSGGGMAGAGGATAGSGGVTAGAGGGAPTIPAAPTSLVTQVLSTTSVELTWTDNATDETGYYVYWSTDATKPTTPNATVTAGTSTATAAGLSDGTLYTFWVEAYNAAGSSAAISGTAAPGPVPDQPTGFLVGGTATQLSLNWNDVTGETGYRVYISTTNTQPATPAHELAADAVSYTFPVAEITPLTTYYVWVSAYNAVGNGLPASGTGIAGSAPAAPTGVSITAATPSTFTLTGNWTDASDNESGFNVYWSTGDTQPATPSATVAAGAQSATLTQVLGGQTYRVWVEAVNAIGKSAAVKATAASVTTDLDWRELWIDGGSTIHLAINDTLSFITDGDTQSQLNVYQSEVATVMGDPTPLTNADYVLWYTPTSNIDITKTHYFWAEAKKPEGSILSLRTLSPGGALTGLTATPSSLSADVSWAATPGVQGYQTFWGTGTFAQAQLSSTGTATATTIVGMSPGTAYSIWARSVGVGIGGNGFWGPVATVTTTTTGSSLGANLAAGKVAKASTEPGPAANVTDGNYGSRWESVQKVDPQWVYVDLGADTAANITHVKAVWEAAYAKSFKIQICNAACASTAPNAPESWAWQDAYAADRTLTDFPSFELLTLTTPQPGRYVRMLGLTRGSDYGYSMYELEVYSAP